MFPFGTASGKDSEPQELSLTSTGTVSDMFKLPCTASDNGSFFPFQDISTVSGTASVIVMKRCRKYSL